MYVNGAVNPLDIVATICLAFGLGPIPGLGVGGIAAATAVSNSLGALTFHEVFHTPFCEITYVRLRRLVITEQFVIIIGIIVEVHTFSKVNRVTSVARTPRRYGWLR